MFQLTGKVLFTLNPECLAGIYYGSNPMIGFTRSVVKAFQIVGRSVLLFVSVAFVSSCTGISTDNSGASLIDAPPPAGFTQGLFVIRTGTPLYPLRARNLQVEGWAMVSFSVNANGNVIQNTIELVDSEPEGYFERSSVVAAREFEFENFDNTLVEDVRYVFRFELDEVENRRPVVRPNVPQIREMLSRRFVTPDYPQAAAEQGISGYVIVEFTVSTNGSVSDVVIVENQPQEVFDAVALDAANRLRFEPRLVNGEPVTVENVQFRFDWDPNR